MDDNAYSITPQRKNSLDYLRRVHEGKVHWMNIVKITPDQICSYDIKNLEARSKQWFLLGLSIGRLLVQPNEILLQSLMQLMEEYDYFTYYEKPETFPTFKWYPRTDASSEGDLPTLGKKQPSVPRAQLHKVGRKVIFQQLLAYSVDIPLNYCEVIRTLCEVLSLIYSKLLARSAVSRSGHKAITKFDTWMKTKLFAKIVEHISMVSKKVLEGEFELISRNLLAPYKQHLKEMEEKIEKEKIEKMKEKQAQEDNNKLNEEKVGKSQVV
eukprot:jgi/Bigna1/134703/aug1.26_g9411